MITKTPVTVRTIGLLHGIRREAGLPTSFTTDVPAEGREASVLAVDVGLPLEAVEGIFHNYTKSGLDSVIRPGDRVAFVPYGTPASHPAFFGPFGEGDA